MKLLKFKLFLAIIFVIGIAVLFSGCWGNQETDETAYVMAMGFDKGEDGNLLITFQIANPKVVAGAQTNSGGGGGDAPYLYNTLEAPLPIAGYTLLNTIHTRKISLLHTKAYIFSEELAKEGLSPLINPLILFRETRGTAFAFVCRGSASDLMRKNTVKLEISPAKQYEMVDKLTKQLGLSSMTQLYTFYQATKMLSPEPMLPLVGVRTEQESDMGPPEGENRLGDYLPGDLPEKGASIQFIGMALFDNDKMLDMITGDETRYLLMLRGKLNQSFLIITDPVKPDYKIGLVLRQNEQPHIRMDLSGEFPSITIELFLDVILVGIPSNVDYAAPENKLKLENELGSIVGERCNTLIDRAQNVYHTDIFHLGDHAKGRFWTNEQWQEYNWSEKFPKATIQLSNLNIEVRQTGKFMRTKQ